MTASKHARQILKTGQLYIALSDDLLSWAQDAGQLFLFKIGTTSDPESRLRALNQGWPNDPDSGPCLNCTDWRWAERWHYRARAVANADEEQLKDFLKRRWRVFDRDAHPRFASVKPDGATEVYQIREAELPEIDELVALSGSHRNDMLNAAVMSAIARHIRAEIEALFPAVPPPDDPEEAFTPEEPWEPEDLEDPDEDAAEEDWRREAHEQASDLLSDQDDYDRSNENGWLHPDD